jgi:hypothetical protein
MSEAPVQPDESRSGLHIDWLKAIAGALAAVASAVLLSTLGAAGTIIGAAIGSLVVTISSALFTQGLSTSKRTLSKAQTSAARKVGIAQAEVRRAERVEDTAAHDSHLEHADERLGQARDELDAAALEAAPTPWRQRLRELPWRRILIAAAALFVAALVVLTVFELAAGRSVSSITGGSGSDQRTTIVDTGGDDSDDNGDDEDEQPTQTPSTSESSSPSDASSPSESASESASDSATPDTAEPTPTPAETSVEPQASSSSGP